MALHAGITLLGEAINAAEIATAKTAFTIRRRKKITIMKRCCARAPTASRVKAPMDRASWRTLAQIAPKSWTPAKKIVPHDHPDEGRQPSPHDGDRGADDGGGARHSSEVMSPKNESVGGDVIDIVALEVSRRGEIRIEPVDLFCNEAGVKAVAKKERAQAQPSQQSRAHGRDPSEKPPDPSITSIHKPPGGHKYTGCYRCQGTTLHLAIVASFIRALPES